MGKKFILWLVAIVILTPMTAGADICGDINEMANGWNEMANGINELDLAAITDQDEYEIEMAVEEAFDATQEFADLLEGYGNSREGRLGERLNDALEDLEYSETVDQVVDSIDSVVDTLDQVTDYCDTQ